MCWWLSEAWSYSWETGIWPQTESKVVLPPESFHAVTACILSSSHFISSSVFRAPGRWSGHAHGLLESLNHFHLSWRLPGRRKRSGVLSPALAQERGLSVRPPLSLKLHPRFWITIHPELNLQLRTHWERQKVQFNVYLFIQSILIICRFHICKIIRSLKFICNAEINTFCALPIIQTKCSEQQKFWVTQRACSQMRLNRQHSAFLFQLSYCKQASFSCSI